MSTKISPVGARLALLIFFALLLSIGIVQGFIFGSTQASTTAAFTPGNLAVYRVGTGTGALSATSAAVFVDEYPTAAGTPVQSIAMPTSISGSNRRLVASGSATSEGLLTLSTNANFLTLTGYDAATGTANVATTASGTVNRVVGRVDATGATDTTTALTDADDGSNIRSVASTDGTSLWTAGTNGTGLGATGGVRSTTLASTTSTQVSSDITNARQVNIFGAQLYVSSAAANFHGVNKVGSGTPTTGGQTITRLAGFTDTNSPSPYGFVILDDPANPFNGLDTIYVADDTTGGVEGGFQKWSSADGTNWSRQYRALAGAAAFRGVTGKFVGATLSLFATTTDNRLVSVQDTGSGFTFTTLATGAANTALRGVAFVPGGGGGPSPSPTPSPTPVLSINDVTQAEGNAGTSTFTFTVSLSAPALAGGVTFDIATADGTAQDGNPGTEDNDYVAKSETGRTIAAGNTSATFTVTVNGDTTPEANETFFVNVTNIVGATVGDAQGLGTITNDDVGLTPIHTIQGSGTSSPFAGNAVTTSGIVTGLRSNGFFLQEPDGGGVDGDPNTSEGIFVFTSSAPPAAAVLGNLVQVSGTVAEFVPASDPGTPSQTELTTPTVSITSTGNSLPAPITITAADTLVNNINNLEKYEGMRVHVNSLTVGGPTGGNVDEVNATSTSFGDFYGVITGVPRPFREPGIEVPYPTPTPFSGGPAPASAPTFDANPERIRVNSLGLTGSVDLQVASNAVVTGVTGPLDYGFRTYTIDTDPPSITPTPLVSGGITLTAVPVPTSRELTIGSFNMQRFFDTTDDPAVADVVLTSTAFNNRLNKASLAIRNVMNSPDVIGIEEMENLTTLQAVASKVNGDSGGAVTYSAFLVEGNDVGGIDVGFLVKTQANAQTRIIVNSVTQYNKTETFTDPSGGTTLLNDRPPLVLRASIVQPSGATLSFSAIVNHLRSLGSVTLSTNAGAHTRVKRNLEAASLARLINEMQNGGPNGIQMLPFDQNIVSVGDYNSFQFNDGYDDVMGVVKGTPAPASQVVESSADLNNPDLTDLIDLLPADQKYSYTFGGNAQALDHTVANPNMISRFSRFAYARMDADFPDSLRNDPNRPERISDHDPEVAYFNMAIVPTATNGVVSGRVAATDGQPVSGAVVSLTGAQSRKTITDVNGNYHFDNVEASGFYTVTPSRANYTFSPGNRAFSLLGNRGEASFTAEATGDVTNPLEVAEYFVRQQYLDLLGREPDEGGFNYWSDQINQCGNDSSCTSARRRDVAAAFFIEQEFQVTGSYIYGLYKGALGRRPGFGEYSSDHQQVVGGANLETRKQAFAEAFVRRTDFVQKYQANTSAESFVDAMVLTLRQSSGVDLGSQRDSLISRYHSGANLDQSRSFVVRDLTESPSFRQAEYNPAFVLSEYFSYLHRNPDADGFAFWVNVLNNGDAGNYRGMVCAFINSAEYQRRFSSVVSRGDGECAR